MKKCEQDVLNYITQNSPYILDYKQLINDLSYSYGTIRNAISKLCKENLVGKSFINGKVKLFINNDAEIVESAVPQTIFNDVDKQWLDYVEYLIVHPVPNVIMTQELLNALKEQFYRNHQK